MVGGRFREAMADVAETIRRVFQDPPARTVDLGLGGKAPRTVTLPTTSARTAGFLLEPVMGCVPMLEGVPPISVGFHWEASLQREAGWARWAAGAQVCVLPLFPVEKCSRLEVPPLPRRARAREAVPGGFRARTLPGLDPLSAPRAGGAPFALAAPDVHQALEQAMALPVAFVGEDIPKLSKALWMRYTLKLVRETGENIRNLEVLGLYRIPSRGTRQINHQATTGRLLVSLGPEAVGAQRAPFILARKKNDDAIVCCFVEET